MRGSSPLTRGKQSPLPSLVGGLRLIPAHAGKTLMDSSAASRARAHPRSRGENLVSQTMPGTHGGSSPLTRGKLAQEAATSTSTRLIPAHAGKTGDAATRQTARRAHPRSRGENGIWERASESAGGSSPLTRGKLSDVYDEIRDIRLIPAHAGKTIIRDFLSQFVPAHPRSRGENVSSRISPGW